MLIVMQSKATPEQVQSICERIESFGFRAHPIEGTQHFAVAVTGDLRGIETCGLEEMPGVQEIVRISKPYKLAGRESKPENTVVRFANSDVTIGGDEFAIIAGPCSVESREQTLHIAEKVAASGARFFRGGAYKPRTSPYAFQGMGVEGLKILAEARERTGMLIVTEAVDIEALEAIEDYADMIQIGARNMQNFSLLKRAGRSPLPVLLKRGLSATLEELLMSAEYIMSEGNRNVVLCERGIRTFADHSRNTLDLSVIPAVHKLSHLPILSDPSHGTGKRDRVTPLALASAAVGADGLIVEVHHDPERALSDGPQSMFPEQFANMVSQLRGILPVVKRTLSTEPLKPRPAATQAACK
ncbi:MAG: 3-deoxy-7-phosphoheptulonate synthase [Acidobacteriota bacterium]|nr:3-deoxy-7-phosphoheptulonate synthase [Acidobacteriota bacterium]